MKKYPFYTVSILDVVIRRDDVPVTAATLVEDYESVVRDTIVLRAKLEGIAQAFRNAGYDGAADTVAAMLETKA